ncbi:hypothetical protein AAW12_14595 [Sphingobacterium sp. Ag1]|nr:hypothetical protein AAW12_14595 [Sphingobacterium sp. Ag1]
MFLKYVVFFFILAFIENRFQNAVINNANTLSEFIKLSLGYVLYILLYVCFLVLFFNIPLCFILQIRNKTYFIVSMLVFFTIEYVLYTYWFSPSNKITGIYNLIIGILIFAFFYKKLIIQMFRNHIDQ